MLDIKLMRKEKEIIEAKLRGKEPSLNLKPVFDLDTRIRELKTEVEKLKADRNELSKQVGDLKRQQQPTETLMERVRAIGDKIAEMDRELTEKEAAFIDAFSRVPNIPMDDVKVSQDPADNVVLKRVGRNLNFLSRLKII